MQYQQQNQQQQYQPQNQNYYQKPDEGGFLWGLLGFFVPVAGLILYLIWKDEKPRTAKAAGMGALVSLIAGIVFFIIYMIFVFLIAFAAISLS